jgi:hypothetical protein
MARTLMMGEQSSDVEFILPAKPYSRPIGIKLPLRAVEVAMPDVLIMRHAEAAPGYPDQARRLTPHGELEAEKMARWLAERLAEGELSMPRIYASPYARAQQTAQRALRCAGNVA